MKKIIILILAILPTFGHAQLQPKVAISYGYYNVSFHVNNTNFLTTYQLPNFMFRSGLEYKIKKISLYYDQMVWCKAELQRHSFSPQQAIFEVGVKYNITKRICISYAHTCIHPVITDDRAGHLYGGKDEITLSYGY